MNYSERHIAKSFRTALLFRTGRYFAVCSLAGVSLFLLWRSSEWVRRVETECVRALESR